MSDDTNETQPGIPESVEPKVEEAIPQEYIDAGNTEYSGTSETGKDVGRHYDDSNDN